jgi:hypothetical protein
MVAPSTRTGMTRTPRLSAASISIRTKSLGLSMRRRLFLSTLDGDERVADGHAFGQQLDKINAGRNAIDVKEDVLAT